MEEHVLNEEIFYDAADVQNKSIPIEEIKYIGISVQPFTDISFILKAPNLEVVTLRLCSLENFPQEFFSLPKLKSLDLSGNAIEKLPEKESFSMLTNLRFLNLQDNLIAELSEIFKINGAPNIRQLALSGNLCISQNDSFNLIIKEFKNLVVLNDLIVTSQHRAFIDNIAQFDSNSCLPTSKTDDFFFLYVKYLHTSSNERYIRRSNAEYFCINRVIRKYSAAEKIQSVFRGYMSRIQYQKIINAALNLQSFLKLWYNKRLKAANHIRSSFLYYKTRQVIKSVRSIRMIQSSWRRKISREIAVIEVFDNNGSYNFLIPQNKIEKIQSFIKTNNLTEPNSITETQYKLIRTKPPKKVPLPGSPIIFYNCDDSTIVRICHNHTIPKNASIWCSHNHKTLTGRIKVTNYGINYTRQCPFASIPMIKIVVPKKSFKFKQYDTLIKFNYNDREKFASVIRSFLSSKIDVTIYPERNLITASAQTTIQSSFKTFIERLKNFREIKQKAIEKRAILCIRYSLKTMTIHRCVSHIAKTIKYFNSLPHSQTFYIPYQYYSSLISMKKKYDVDFGYASDKSLILNKNSPDGFLKKIIPNGTIIFALNDLPSIVNFGVISSKVQSPMFSIPIPMKYVKRYRIMRLTYVNPDEARKRLTLFAWMTNKFDVIMTERNVLEFCCANAIHSCWRGYASRRRLVHILIQMGSLFDHSKLFKKMNFKGSGQYNFKKLSMIDDSNSKNKNSYILEPLSSDPVESIHELRHDYRPWEKQLKDFREVIHNENKYKDPQDLLDKKTKNSQNDDSDDDDKEISQSALNVGLLTTKELKGVEIQTIKIQSKSALNKNHKNNIANTNKGRHSNIENTKLNNLLLSKTENSELKDNVNQKEFSTQAEKNANSSLSSNHNKADILAEDEIKIIEVNESNDDDEDNFDGSFDISKNKKKLLTNIRKENLSIPQSHSQLTLPISYNSFLKNENKDKSNLRSNQSSNNKSQSVLIDDPLLSSIDNDIDDNPRLMAPFFTGSPKRKVREIDGEDTSEDSNNHSSQVIRPLRLRSSKSAFSIFSTFDVQSLIKDDKTPTGEQEKEPEIEDDSSKKLIRSSQKNQNNFRELLKIAFSKLSRLHHLGLIIMSNSAVDNSIEKNRQIAHEAREEHEKKRAANEMQKNTLSSEVHQRAQIEHSMLLEQIQDQRTSAKKEKTKKVKEIRHDQRVKKEKYLQSKNFGQNFVNMARVISHQAEMNKKGFCARSSLFPTQSSTISTNSASFSFSNTKSNSVFTNSMSFGNKKQQMIQRKAVSSLRQAKIDNRNALKEFNNELEQQRRRLALLDKIHLEYKRKKNNESKSEKMKALYEAKRKEKERKKLMKSQLNKNAAYNLPPPIPQVQEDVKESAIKDIGPYIGANLGIVESHLLIDIINNIIMQ